MDLDRSIAAAVLLVLAVVSVFLLYWVPKRLKRGAKASGIRSSKMPENMTLRQKLTYYRFVRLEVAREDKILHERMTWLIQFQGFMIAAVATLIAFGWPTGPDVSCELQQVLFLKKLTFLALPSIGIVFGHAASVGIQASRQSLEETSADWARKDEDWRLQYSYVPQPVGQNKAYRYGKNYPIFIIALFIFMWHFFIATYVLLYWNDLSSVVGMLWTGGLPGCPIPPDA